MTTSKVLYEKRGPVAYVTLNRPEVKNAIDVETHERLCEIWTDFRDDPAMRDSVTVHMKATPEQVWDLVSDVTRIGEFSPETFEAEWVDGATGRS